MGIVSGSIQLLSEMYRLQVLGGLVGFG